MRTVRFYTSILRQSIYTNYEVTSVLATSTAVFTLGRWEEDLGYTYKASY